MNLSLMDAVLWGAGFLANSVLLLVLTTRGRWRILPWFTTWIGYQVVSTIGLYAGFRWGSRGVYADLYWSGALIDLLLQVALVVEIAHLVLRIHGEWAEGARARFYGSGVAGAVFSGVMAWWIAPAAASSLEVWELRGSLFSTMLICCCFTGVMVASQRLGLVWRGHVMRVGYGLIVWSFTAFATDTMHSYWGTARHFAMLEHARQWIYLLAVVYWVVAMWLPEAASEQMSSAMTTDLVQLQARAPELGAREPMLSKRGSVHDSR